MNIASGHSSWGRVITQPCLIYYLNSLASDLQLSSYTFAKCWGCGSCASLLPTTGGNSAPRSNPRFGVQLRRKMDENPPCYARNYMAKQVSICSGILWSLLVSNSCWVIFKSRGDSEVCLQGDKPVDEAYRC